VRLFCFPYSGGGASIFRLWPQGLPEEIEVCSIQLAGHESRLREPLFTRLTPLVQALTQAISPYLNMPFAFFGHSLGALVSFELARQFHRQALPAPVHLFVSGRRAPQFPEPGPPTHQLPDAQFVSKLRRLSGTPEGVLQDAELMQLFLPILRADFAIIETFVYSAGAKLACPISAFGGLQDSETSREDIAGWREQTSGPFELRMLPGDHFFLHSARAQVLQHIAQDLLAL
jgi:medium-chain acyl-[acyl-carrier-protein] hydrolase